MIEFNRDCMILNDQIECNSRNKFEEPFCDTVTTISQFVQNVHRLRVNLNNKQTVSGNTQLSIKDRMTFNARGRAINQGQSLT